jgi:hypothetical protein
VSHTSTSTSTSRASNMALCACCAATSHTQLPVWLFTVPPPVKYPLFALLFQHWLGTANSIMLCFNIQHSWSRLKLSIFTVVVTRSLSAYRILYQFSRSGLSLTQPHNFARAAARSPFMKPALFLEILRRYSYSLLAYHYSVSSH